MLFEAGVGLVGEEPLGLVGKRFRAVTVLEDGLVGARFDEDRPAGFEPACRTREQGARLGLPEDVELSEDHQHEFEEPFGLVFAHVSQLVRDR